MSFTPSNGVSICSGCVVLPSATSAARRSDRSSTPSIHVALTFSRSRCKLARSSATAGARLWMTVMSPVPATML
jgi:hypothetical protein